MKRLGVALSILAVAVLAGALAWTLWATGALNFSGGSAATIAIIAAGVVLTGALAGVLMWLSFYSARKGYDDGLKFDPPSGDETAGPPDRT